jgi:serpin B
MRYAGGELAMVIVLPRKPDGLGALEASLTSEKLSGIVSGLRTHLVTAQVPKFKLSEGLELGHLLSGMGMTLAFSGEADFSGIADREPLFFSEAIHKAYLDVDEKGTEAAAATAVMMTRAAFMSRKPVVFRADHPFVFVIRDRLSGSILFIGRLVNPAL